MYIEKSVKNAIKQDYINICQTLKKCHSKSQYFYVMEDLRSLLLLSNTISYDVKKDVGCEYYHKNYFNRHQYDFEKNFDRELDIKQDFFINLAKNLIPLIDDSIPYKECNYQEYLNLEQINQELANFFVHINPQILKLYVDALQKNHVITYENEQLLSKNTAASTIIMMSGSTPYIFLEKDDSLQMAFELIHEMGHYYETIISLQGINKKTPFYFFDETYAYFLEFIAQDFYKNNDYYYPRCVSERSANKWVLKDSLSDILTFYYSKENNVDFLDIYNAIIYGVGMSLASYFYESYLKDPEKTLYNINQFLVRSKALGLDSTLHEFGIDYDKFMSGSYIKSLDLTQKN